MNIAENAKAPRVTTEGLSENQNQINAGGIEKSFDVFHDTETAAKLQCLKCNPPLVKPHGAPKLCPSCQIETDQTTEMFFNNFKRHRRIYKLDCLCFGCKARKTSAMMSKIFSTCRCCADELKAKGATAQSNFISRATNNFFRELKRAVTI
jgi:hypothetical protein